MRALLLALAACGRVGFDAPGDGGAGDTPTSTLPLGALAFPSGAAVTGLAFAPDNSERYAITSRAVYRIGGGTNWMACAALAAGSIAVDGAGIVYAAAGSDVYASTDRCASWTSLGGPPTQTVAVVGNHVWALSTSGVQVHPADVTGTWTALPGAFEGHSVRSVAASADGMEILLGSDTAGALRSTDGGATWQPSTGLTAQSVAGLAISPQDELRAYAIEGSTGGASAVLCSTDGGATWVVCYGNGGEAIAVDPGDPGRVLAAAYDRLVATSDGFATFDEDVRGHDLDESRVHAVAFAPTGDPVVGSDRGVFEASDAALTWIGSVAGLDAWTIQDITLDGADIYASTYGGALVSHAGAPFTLSTTGMSGNTNIRGVLVTSAPTALISVGLFIRRSDDGGQTWMELVDLSGNDGYYAVAAVQLGARIIVATGGRTMIADPPWTTWTPVLVGGALRQVNTVLVRGTTVWVGADNGLFMSTDAGETYARIAAVTGEIHRLALLGDGRLVAATEATVWLSDAAAQAWRPTMLAGYVTTVATSGQTIAAITNAGVEVTHDTGATWTTLSTLHGVSPLSLAFEPGGTLLVGTDGSGITRVAVP